MNVDNATPFDWFFLGSCVFLILMFSYQAYMNLFLGKISKFSIDAILVFLIIKFGDEKSRKRAKAFSKNTDRILLFGVYSVFTVAGGIYEIILWLEKYVQK